jgi:hypothetical protein
MSPRGCIRGYTNVLDILAYKVCNKMYSMPLSPRLFTFSVGPTVQYICLPGGDFKSVGFTFSQGYL